MATPNDIARLASRRAPAPPPAAAAETQDGPFRLRFDEAVRDSRMTPHGRLVALTLASYADPHTGAIPEGEQPHLDGLIRATGLRPGQLVVALRALEQRGWIRQMGPRRERYETARLQPVVPDPLALAHIRP